MSAGGSLHAEAMQYDNLRRHFATHESVKHGADEDVRGDATTSTVEGFFSIFKRDMKATYPHCGEKRLHR